MFSAFKQPPFSPDTTEMPGLIMQRTVGSEVLTIKTFTWDLKFLPFPLEFRWAIMNAELNGSLDGENGREYRMKWGRED